MTPRSPYDAIAERYATENPEIPDAWRAMLDYIANLVGRAGRVVDVGCGTGAYARLFLESGMDVYGVDVSWGMIKEARTLRGIKLVQMDMHRFAFADGIFDAAWCSSSLLHIPKKTIGVVLGEIARVLKPGGKMFVSLQEGEGESIETCPYGSADRLFVRYNGQEFISLLERAGFFVNQHDRTSTSKRTWLHFDATRGSTTPGRCSWS